MRISRLILASCIASLALVSCGTDQLSTLSQPTASLRTATPAIMPPTYTVQRGEIVEALTLTGRVAPAMDQDVFFTRDGFVKTIYVNKGDTVISGTLLAEIEPGDLTEKLTEAQANYDLALQALQSSRADRARSLQSAQLSLQNAQDNLAQLRQPPSAVQLDAAQAAVEQSRINLESTRREVSAAKIKAEANLINAADTVRDRQAQYSKVVWQNGNRPLDQLSADQRLAQEQAQRALDEAERELQLAQAAYDSARQTEIESIALAEQRLKSAQLALDALLNGPDRHDIAVAERAVTSARLSLDAARADTGSPAMEQQAEEARRALDAVREKIAEGRIYAPLNGVIAEVSVKSGDQIKAFDPVINVMSPSKLTLRVDTISSEDLTRISIGQTATIDFVRYPGHPIPATISSLPSSLTTPGSSVRADTSVRLSFDQANLDLTVGDAANIQIILRRTPDALWLPPQAIQTFDQRRFVVIQNGDSQRQVDIKIGISTADRVQILEGLKDGEVVIGPSAKH